MRANFTQENIEKMKAFDPELARKAQLAYDHKLPINFQQLEIIDEALPRLLEEKKQLEPRARRWASCPWAGRTPSRRAWTSRRRGPCPGRRICR